MVNTGSMFTFITKCTLKTRLEIGRGVFTFTICSHFRRIGIVVPLYSHATNFTPTPSYHPKSHPHHSTHIFGQNLTIPYLNSPKNHNKLTQFHTISHLPLPNYPTPLKP